MSAVVSLGTGMIPVTELKEIDVFRPDSLFDAAKLAYGISAIGRCSIVHSLRIDIHSTFFSRIRKFTRGPSNRIRWTSCRPSQSLV